MTLDGLSGGDLQCVLGYEIAQDPMTRWPEKPCASVCLADWQMKGQAAGGWACVCVCAGVGGGACQHVCVWLLHMSTKHVIPNKVQVCFCLLVLGFVCDRLPFCTSLQAPIKILQTGVAQFPAGNNVHACAHRHACVFVSKFLWSSRWGQALWRSAGRAH